jgi:hypothetical protein
MLKSTVLFVVLALSLFSSSVKAAVLWNNIDSDFVILNGLDTSPADPKTYTIQVKNISANNYSSVYLIIPFQWNLEVTRDNVVVWAGSGTWNDGTSKWDNAGYTFEITNAAFLTKMTDTDISMSYPLSVPDPYTAALATINGSDSVPTVYVGSVNAGQTVSFNVDIDFGPFFVPTLFTGYFVKPVPEPASIGLLAVSAIGLLVRRR